jgi:hypothetical protein
MNEIQKENSKKMDNIYQLEIKKGKEIDNELRILKRKYSEDTDQEK